MILQDFLFLRHSCYDTIVLKNCCSFFFRGYYGRGNFLTDEEKANFDYNKCLEVRGKLPKKLSRPKKLPKRGSGPNEQQREQRRGDTGVSGNSGTPKHPKMIIFSRKTPGCWGNPPF